jgi:LemA protein
MTQSEDLPRPSPFGSGSSTSRRGFGGGGRPRWLIPLAVGIGVLLLVVGPAVGSYNGLVDKDEAVNRQFANLEVVLQRRYDLIPQLSEAVRAAIRQEQVVFGEIARARTRYGGAGTPDEKVAAAGELESAFARLLVVVEQYPQLQSNQVVRDFTVQLEGTENRIAQERRDYNEVVVDYNRTIRRFPRSLFAGIFGFDRRAEFRSVTGADAPPPINLDVTPTTPAPSPTG